MRRAVTGMLRDGGFHTPNHRWVIASALAQAGALLPDLEVAPLVDAYLAEGIDINAEGAYLERSIGVYDGVTNRSLLLLADYYDAPTAPQAVVIQAGNQWSRVGTTVSVYSSSIGSTECQGEPTI